VQLYRYFVSQSSDFCRHNSLCCFSTSILLLLLFISLLTQSGNFWIHPRTSNKAIKIVTKRLKKLETIPGRHSTHLKKNLLFRQLWGSTQPPIQWVPRALFMGIKRPRSETEHSLVPRLRMRGVYLHSHIRLHGTAFHLPYSEKSAELQRNAQGGTT